VHDPVDKQLANMKTGFRIAVSYVHSMIYCAA